MGVSEMICSNLLFNYHYLLIIGLNMLDISQVMCLLFVCPRNSETCHCCKMFPSIDDLAISNSKIRKKDRSARLLLTLQNFDYIFSDT